MFDPEILSELARDHQEEFMSLGDVERELNERFFDMEKPIRAMMLSVLSGEPLLLLGPPGTAKSKLIRAFCEMIGVLKEPEKDKERNNLMRRSGYFEYLLTPFTEPGELFGFYDISKVREGILERLDDNMMQQAEVVYLDEVFNGSSAILNSILAFLNEGFFHDRGNIVEASTKCLFAAANRPPETPDLLAVFDRFVLRCAVDNVRAAAPTLGRLVHMGWKETYSRFKSSRDIAGLLDRIKGFQEKIELETSSGKLIPRASHPFYNRLAQLVKHARSYELSRMSNRRIIKMVRVMMIHRVYDAVLRAEEDSKIELDVHDLQLMPDYFLDRVDDEEAINKMRDGAVKPVERK